MNAWWLLLLAPVIIHWLNRGSGKPYPVGDLRFFARQSPRQLRVSRPRRWLLLALRMALVATGIALLIEASEPTSGQNPAPMTAVDSSPRITTMPALAEAFEREVDSPLVLADDATLGTSLLPERFAAEAIVAPDEPAETIRIGVSASDEETRKAILGELEEMQVVGLKPIKLAEDNVDVWITDGDTAELPAESWKIQWRSNSGAPIAAEITAAGPRTFATADPDARVLDQILRWIPSRDAAETAVSTRTESVTLLGLLLAVLTLLERWLAIRDESRAR